MGEVYLPVAPIRQSSIIGILSAILRLEVRYSFTVLEVRLIPLLLYPRLASQYSNNTFSKKCAGFSAHFLFV